MNDCSPSPEGPPNVTVSGKPRRALLGLDTAGLEALSREMGQPAYRGRQLADWLYRKRATSLEAMGNLPRAFRDSLEAAATVGAPRVLHVTEAPDRTTKFLLAMARALRRCCSPTPTGPPCAFPHRWAARRVVFSAQRPRWGSRAT
jgi:hypothetical protein